MVDGNNKAPTEMHTFLPVENSKDDKLTSKYTVQVISKDSEAAATLTRAPPKDLTQYDPFKERKHVNPTTDCDTLAHLLKASLGTGILSMPYAFRHAGLLVGIIGTMIVSLICTHCSYILVKCAHVLYYRTNTAKMGYADVAEAAFATGPKWSRRFSKYSRYFVQWSLFLTYFGTCSAYTVIIAANFGHVLDKYLYPNNATNASEILSNITTNLTATVTENHTETDLRIIVACLLLPLILLVWVPDLKYLAPASMIANLFMAIGLGITFYYLVVDMPPVTTDLLVVDDLSKLPEFFSVTIFAMEAIGVIMPLENNMKTPQHFVGICGILNKGMSGVTLVYIILGFLGHLKFPNSKEDIVTKDLSIDLIPAQIVKILIGLAVFLTFGLQFYVCLDIAWTSVKDKFVKNPRLSEYIVRTVLVVVCVLLAILVPKIAPLVGLIGAFCFSILGILAPVIIETLVCLDTGFGYMKWVAIKNIVLTVVGLIVLVLGTKDAVKGIISAYI